MYRTGLIVNRFDKIIMQKVPAKAEIYVKGGNPYLHLYISKPLPAIRNVK